MKFLAVAVVAALLSCSAFADACQTGSLDQYSSGTCSLGPMTITWAPAFIANQSYYSGVTVTPYINGTQYGFTFSGLPTAVASAVDAGTVSTDLWGGLAFTSLTLNSGYQISTLGGAFAGSQLTTAVPNFGMFALASTGATFGYDLTNWGYSAQSAYSYAPMQQDFSTNFNQTGIAGSYGCMSCAAGTFSFDEFVLAAGSGAYASASASSITSYVELAPAPVPEPSQLLLVSSSLLAAGTLIRRRVKRRAGILAE